MRICAVLTADIVVLIIDDQYFQFAVAINLNILLHQYSWLSLHQVFLSAWQERY